MKSLDSTWRTLSSHQSSRAVAAKLNGLKPRNVQKSVYSARLTILCGIITILVLRGTVGTGYFSFDSGSETSNVDDLGFAVEQQHEIPVVEENLRETLRENLNREDLKEKLGDRTKQGKKNVDEDPVIDQDVPFALGPPIKDWNEQRSEWLAAHKNLTKNKYGRERILLVSGSASKPCLNPVGDHLLVKSLKNKMDYCRSALFCPLSVYLDSIVLVKSCQIALI